MSQICSTVFAGSWEFTNIMVLVGFFFTRTFDVLYYRCALGGLIAGRVRGDSLKPVWCLPLVLFMAELEAVSEIKNRCA